MNICWTPYLRPLAWATLAANIGIVVTGGAVRLTGSGLGCPTWPRCTEESFTPHGELDLHSAVEFGNRMLTFVLVAIAIATFVAAWQSGRRELRRWALVLALGIPAQAVIGGITVLTDLNPWVVAFHLLCSMAMIGIAVLFLRLVGTDGPLPEPSGNRYARGLAWTTFAAGWAVLYVGTMVTGSGPHAGDEKAPRNGLDPEQLSQVHADLVFLFIGLTVGMAFAAHALGASAEVLRAARLLLVVELAQGLIGFVQYFTDLPEVLVGVHMLGAGLVSAAMTWAVLATPRGLGAMAERGHLVYDADCGFCTRSAAWLDPDAVAWFTLDLDAVGVTQQVADANAGWLAGGRITALGADAIAASLRARGGGARILGFLLTVPGLRALAGVVYPRIAANRHRMPGGTAACRIVPPDEKKEPR